MPRARAFRKSRGQWETSVAKNFKNRTIQKA